MPYQLKHSETFDTSKKNITFAIDTSSGEVIQYKVTNLKY